METAGFSPRYSDDKSDTWEIPESQMSENSSITQYETISNFQLHMLQKKDPISERPKIYSTKCQRLSFYRAYTTPEYKTEIISRYHAQFNSFFWFYMFDLIFKSLPHAFVHIFLASYAPESHIFLTKMVPFCIGYTFLLIAASCLEIITYMNSVFLMYHYFINGILYKNPWNRCKSSIYFDAECNETIHCYQFEEFTKQFINRTCHFSGHTYKTPNNVSFQVAQVEYFRLNIGSTFHIHDIVNLAILWSMVAILTYYVSYKSFWKVLHYVHLFNISIDFCAFLFLISTQTTPAKQEKILVERSVGSSVIWLDMVAESTTAPPVAHILTSRSTQATVTFRCLIEMVIYEWKPKINIKAWMVITFMFGSSVLMYTFFDYEFQEVLYVYAKGFATLVDTVILYIFYPLGRLVDDYTFHYGVPPTKLRKISLQFVPFYSLVKFIAMMDALFEILENRNSKSKGPFYKWSGYFMLVPILLGMVYTLYKQIVIKKAKWYDLFRPKPKWGPKDFTTRQLRKMYDSRTYIKSAVPRPLSRYLISKAESEVYKLDVRYDVNKRPTSSTLTAVRFMIEHNMKKKSL